MTQVSRLFPALKPVRLRRLLLAIAVLVTAAGLVAPRPAAAPAASPAASVIVRELRGAQSRPENLVRSLGGRIDRHIGVIRGFSAELPVDSVDELRASPWVHSVTRDRRVELLQFSPSYDPATDLGSLYNLTRSLEAPEMWKKGYTGRGVGVALIDSGVVPVNGLNAPGKVVNGPDLSFESQAPNLRYMDSFGHGTHMAGIIAGRDNAAVPGAYDKKEYAVGVAPDATIVNIKVATYEGATDVSQILAAIDWVIAHRNDEDLNIRVLNLSFGTDGTQDYRYDPLTFAVEAAWRKGIVVVAAAGNSGFGNAKLNNPAYDPFVIAVGAVKAQGTPDTADDTVPEWSSRGDGTRNPDVVAPGASITSLRAPGSYIDRSNPGGVVHERFFRGSGTSQAAAAVSGAVALVAQQRPSATPDQIKKLLMSTATPMPIPDPVSQGSGIVNLENLLTAPTPRYKQTWLPATGLGSLRLARGSATLTDHGVALDGDADIFGQQWNGATWAAQSGLAASWLGGVWNGKRWSGDCWCSTSWSGDSWASTTWTGKRWS
ncbi:MAG: S8 family serine peptidase, partial [Actinomycetota bacterium]|nr:S8 family serine peptidase [Actinomycetota bacterium]